MREAKPALRAATSASLGVRRPSWSRGRPESSDVADKARPWCLAIKSMDSSSKSDEAGSAFPGNDDPIRIVSIVWMRFRAFHDYSDMKNLRFADRFYSYENMSLMAKISSRDDMKISTSFGSKCFPFSSDDDGDGLVHGESLLVGPGRNQGVKDIHKAHDAGFDGDAHACQIARIPLPVPALMVRQCDEYEPP
jgi:hypothetical protein